MKDPFYTNSMTQIGIVEGFFGPTWSNEARHAWAAFLKKYGGDFYIYAPKRDSFLRKSWKEAWNSDYLDTLKNLRDVFQNQGLKFGVALSPFGLGSSISATDWEHLKTRFSILKNLDLDYLGLFFDDMPSTDDLLKVQKQVVELALEYFPQGLIFCPSYYSFDPILDKVFGERPIGYVEGLKDAIPPEVEICWTGPKVISEIMSAEHLQEVKTLLGRKPFIWENLYANDGPRNCKFLKLRYFSGRDSSVVNETQAIGLNLMNQPYLSQITYLSSLWAMTKKLSPEVAFEKSCQELCSHDLAEFILKNRLTFLETGLDKITIEQKKFFLSDLDHDSSPIALEIKSWLNGDYIVGPECLTD
jgi:hyaluronoglucosaminidase